MHGQHEDKPAGPNTRRCGPRKALLVLGALVAAGGGVAYLLYWLLAPTLPRSLKSHIGPVLSVAFSPDGKTLAAGSAAGLNHPGEIKLWEMASGQVKATFTGLTGNIQSVAFSPNGKAIAAGSDVGTIKLWDGAIGKELVALEHPINTVLSIAFSPDGNTLAGATAQDAIKLWDVTSGKNTRTLKGTIKGRDRPWFTSVTFSPDGKILAAGCGFASGGGGVTLWDVASGNEKATLKGHEEIRSVAFSSDGKTLAAGPGTGTGLSANMDPPNYNPTVRLWDVASGQGKATLHGHTGSVFSVVFSPDGKNLAVASRGKGIGEIRVWDVASGQERVALKGHTGRVYALGFSPDGKTLAAGCADLTSVDEVHRMVRLSFPGEIKLWDLATRH